jgi:hypothetical protein
MSDIDLWYVGYLIDGSAIAGGPLSSAKGKAFVAVIYDKKTTRAEVDDMGHFSKKSFGIRIKIDRFLHNLHGPARVVCDYRPSLMGPLQILQREYYLNGTKEKPFKFAEKHPADIIETYRSLGFRTYKNYLLRE